ncbi:MAG: sigma-54 interaction domain-containing protein [Acidobacteriaceae bacterium]
MFINGTNQRSTIPAVPPASHGIVGQSEALQRIFAQMERIGPYFRTVLITGETGTGKELVARALHALSPAANGPFVVCNASAIVETLFESELFGHVKGAFTGAMADRLGIFESAHHGTLFLDEIGEMSPGTQAKLLRVLQHHEVQRVGSSQSRKVEVRIVAATNRDLRSLAATGHFRQDLFYRISMVEIHLPPMRLRMDDLPLLAYHFLAQYAQEYNKRVYDIAPEALARLQKHAWPGNVRELEHVMGNAVMQAEHETLQPEDLPPLHTPMPIAHNLPGGRLLRLQDVVLQHVRHVLETCGGNKLRAAETLGISRSTLYRMLQSHMATKDFDLSF